MGERAGQPDGCCDNQRADSPARQKVSPQSAHEDSTLVGERLCSDCSALLCLGLLLL